MVPTKDEFLALVQSAPFFERLGSAAPGDGWIALSSLAGWGDPANASDADSRIADEMDRLPTSRDQDDPFYPGGVDRMAESRAELEPVES